MVLSDLSAGQASPTEESFLHGCLIGDESVRPPLLRRAASWALRIGAALSQKGFSATFEAKSSGGSAPARVSRVAVEETGMRFEQVVNRVFAMLTEMRLDTVVAAWAGRWKSVAANVAPRLTRSSVRGSKRGHALTKTASRMVFGRVCVRGVARIPAGTALLPQAHQGFVGLPSRRRRP